MRSLLRALREVARLRLPVTAAAALATFLALVAPFGIQVGDDTSAKITGALVALGVVVEWLRQLLDQPTDPTVDPKAIVSPGDVAIRQSDAS